MQINGAFSRRSLWIILLFMFVLFSAAAGTFYSTLNTISKAVLQADTTIDGQESSTRQMIALVNQKTDDFIIYTLPAIGGGFLAAAILLWLVLRSLGSVDSAVEESMIVSKPAGGSLPATDIPQTTEQDYRLRQRLFVHLLSVLQREGRLVDFFSEDLDAYQDMQIGAAVRSIHENCKAGLNKYLNLEPVVSNPEGQTITLKPGFDAVSIKVVGNVAGDPPFTGIVRHRGWRATNIDIPTLTDIEDNGLIAPAEVELV